MGIIGFLFWIILPFILCVLLIPKYMAANAEYRADYDNPVLLRHIAVAVFPGLIPFINWFAVVTIIGLYLIDYKKIFKRTWLDMEFSDLFKKKETKK